MPCNKPQDRPKQEEKSTDTETDKDDGTKESTEGQAKGDNTPSTPQEGAEGTKLPDKKYKWYEFGKRFNAWKEKRNVQKAIKKGDLPKKDEEEQKKDEEEQKKVKPSSKFRAAYKYDVVKDYIDNQMNEIYKEVLSIRKNTEDRNVE